jgi:hypothetical protein
MCGTGPRYFLLFEEALTSSFTDGKLIYSHLSFALASSFDCHCILLGWSAPPRFSGRTWSTTYPGQAPDLLPVDGQGWSRMNASRAAFDRLMPPWRLRVAVDACVLLCEPARVPDDLFDAGDDS